MIRIGVAGPMASGKSTVARRFESRGATLVEGDRLGWALLRRPAIRARLLEAFGGRVGGADGEIDRGALGRIVFADPAEMDRLNGIVQPALLESVRDELARARGPVVVLDAALLTVWGLPPELDGVVEVTAPDEVRIERLSAARGCSIEEARGRISGQSLPPVRGARRLWRIENGRDRAALERRADEVWGEIASLAGG
jgi:dephospho-CoA kinase